MAAVAATQQPTDGTHLTKPADWAQYMVTAALRFVAEDRTTVTYTSQDEARLDTLNTLNWHEAHCEYEWPDFARLGYDFNQAMRFRRALVNDVFIALQKADKVKVANAADILGTPDSGIVGGTKRSGSVSRRMAERKRQCKRGDESDTDAATDDAERFDQAFLAETMQHLIDRANIEFVGSIDDDISPLALANLIHGDIVNVHQGTRAGRESTETESKRKRDSGIEHGKALRLGPRLELGPRRHWKPLNPNGTDGPISQ